MAAGIITSAVAATAGELVKGLDGLFTSDAERAEAELRMQTLLLQPQIIQALTTLKEAEHPSVFVAGWRPALGWMAAAGLAWEYIGRPTLGSLMHIGAVIWPDASVRLIQAAAGLPALDSDQLMALVAILLGVAGYRTVERVRGVARANLGGARNG